MNPFNHDTRVGQNATSIYLDVWVWVWVKDRGGECIKRGTLEVNYAHFALQQLLCCP